MQRLTFRSSAIALVVFALVAPRALATQASDFDAANFSAPTEIHNKWTPLVPGTVMTFRGEVSGRTGTDPHLNVFIVTGLTKVIDGVTTRVIWDRDIEDGELQESELAFEAQDDAGNVWNLGEYPELYDNGVLKGAPSTWIGGLGDARPGLLMQARPRLNTPAYLQGIALSIKFKDKAQTYRTNQYTCVPTGCYSNVLVMKEWNTFEPNGGFQLKYYAPGVGNVRVEPLGGVDREVLKLVKVKKLTTAELDHVNQNALDMDARARATNTTYAPTPPAQVG